MGEQFRRTKMANRRKNNSDSEEDETLYYRYSSAPPPYSSSSNPSNSQKKSNGSGGLAPSKSTIYISNLDFSLTNSDLHTLFSTFGKLARVTVLKDRVSRVSRGVAFIQFVSRDDAVKATGEMHGKILNGRTLKASIAADNGRAPEFIKKRVYRDKSRCYECGESGHLSYECPKNQLGPRERPVLKRERSGGGGARRGGGGEIGAARGRGAGDEDEWGSDGAEAFEDDNWASVVDDRADERLLSGKEGDAGRKKAKKASYFSDESGEDD